MSAVNLAWLLGIGSLGQPSASDPPKAMVVSKLLAAHCRYPVEVISGSPSISGAVTRRHWLQFASYLLVL